MRRVGLVGSLILLTVGFAARAGLCLPVSVDADQDGVLDTLEAALGASPDDAASTPESLAAPGTCLDGRDDDLDGLTDGEDPGCHLPAASGTTFPAAGDDAFEATLELPRYPLETPFGICPISISARGPVVMRRAEPGPDGGSGREVAFEIVALQLDGNAEFHAEPGYPDCLVPPSTFEVTVFEDPAETSTGLLDADTGDPARDLPALGVLDLYFDVAWGWDKMTVLPGGPPGGPAGAPLQLTNRVNTVPSYLGANPSCWASSQDELCVIPPPGSFLCYDGKFFAPGFEESSVDVSDAFEPETRQEKVRRPALVCTPAGYDGRPVYDPVGHLACFEVKPAKTGSPLHWKSKLLCRAVKRSEEGVSLELPTVLDDYLCYQDKHTDRFGASFERRPIAVSDAFGTVTTDVIAPKLRCNPASLDGAPLRNPERLLECFKLARQRVRETAELFGRNETFLEEIKTASAVSLCVPSAETQTEARQADPARASRS
jgi:hypothetical protein